MCKGQMLIFDFLGQQNNDNNKGSKQPDIYDLVRLSNNKKVKDKEKLIRKSKKKEKDLKQPNLFDFMGIRNKNENEDSKPSPVIGISSTLEENESLKQVITITKTAKEEIAEVKDIESESIFSTIESLTKNASSKPKKKSKAKKPIRYSPSGEDYPSTPVERFNANIDAIKLLNSIEEKTSDNEKYLCTKAELSVLGKFSGWGGLEKFFDSDNKRNELLRDLLGDEYDSAAASVTTGYYTPPEAIKFKYELLKRFGFKKGRILDCSAGVGRYFSYMGKNMYNESRLYGVELDVISSKITALLHPEAEITNSAFERTSFEDEFFDLCISNIPFGDLKVHDNQDRDLNKLNLNIHDYFFMKALKKVRAGGLVAFITSVGFMDKECSKVRELVNEQAELIGVFRLPNNTFNGTNVVSDIVILKKTEKSKSNKHWLTTTPLKEFEDKYSINTYYTMYPQLIGGNLSVISSKFGPVLTVTGEDLTEEYFKAKLKLYPKDIYVPRDDEAYLYKEEDLINIDEISYEFCDKDYPSWIKDLRDDEYVVLDDELYKKENSHFIKQKSNITKYDMIKDYAVLKASLLDICTNNDIDDDTLVSLQKVLNDNYDNFIKKHGYINESKNVKELSKDIAGFPLISSLEDVSDVYDEKEKIIVKQYKKADIFTKRTVGRSAKVEKPKNLQEAISLSFFIEGRLNIALMAEKLEQPYDEVLNACIADNLIFYDFELGKYEHSNDFLSGYVKDKLKYYQELIVKIEKGQEIITVPTRGEYFLSNMDEALKYVSEIKRNIKALEENQPEFEANVEFGISSPWIPLEIKRKFILDMFELKDRAKYLTLDYDPRTGYSIRGCMINSTLRTVEWGTSRVDAERALIHALNDTAPVVKDKIGDKDVVNVEQTQLAVAKVNKWTSEFRNYIFNNPNLHLEIVQVYNDKFVRTKEKEQFNFIQDPEINPEVKLRECQLKGVCRCLTAKTSQLLYYETGVGKTYTMQVLAYMKYKLRMQTEGRPNKTAIIVPNSLALSGQFVREFLTIYPNAKVLALTPNDLEKKNRRKILSKIATNNWHAVILPHSVLGLIPMKKETLEKFYQRDIEEMKTSIRNLRRKGNGRGVYQTEKMIANRKAWMDRLLDMHKDENSIYWEDLGIDDVMVDEAHTFKSLFFVTNKNRVAGISSNFSQRASNLYNIVRYQQEKDPASVTFATATPITNTLGELYNFTRYLNPEALIKRDIYEFDAWAATFGSVVNEVETDVTGRSFKMKPRFAKFHNIPELMNTVTEFADIVFTENVAEIKVPKLVTGKPINIEVEPNESTEEAIQTLVDIVGLYENGDQEIRKNYNMLKICGEGRKIAVSQRLIATDEKYEPLNNISKIIHSAKEPSPKLNAVIDKVYEIYEKHPEMSQAVFCDVGVPKKDSYSAYQEIKDGLVKMGLLPEQIAFIHDCGSDPIKRKEVIKKVNDGLIKVLIGSTQKMGEGVNMQKRLVALHHVDSCWLPSQIKQREGRILRSGNMNKEVYIFRYLVKNSFDVFSWQTLERKAKFINQITSGAKDIRSVSDLGDESISYAEAKAAASGNPLLLEHCKLVSRYNTLKVQEKNYAITQINNKNKMDYLESSIESKSKQLKILGIELSNLKNTDTSSIVFTKDGREYRDKDTILEVLKNSPKYGIIGEVYGLPVNFDAYFDKMKIGESNLVSFSMANHQAAIYRRFQCILSTMETAFEKTTRLIEAYKGELEYLQEYIKKPFDHRDELLEVERRKTDIETELYGSKNNTSEGNSETNSSDIIEGNCKVVDDNDDKNTNTNDITTVSNEESATYLDVV